MVQLSFTDANSDHVKMNSVLSERQQQSIPNGHGLINEDSVALETRPEAFYLPYLSDRAKKQRPNPIRSLLPMERKPGMISLLAGKPNPETFPITSFSFTTRHPSGSEVKLSLDGDALAVALQYNFMSGIPELVSWITGLQEKSHGRNRSEGWRISMGVGSQDVISKCMYGILNDGDTLLVETPSYPGVVPLFQSMNIHVIEIPVDSNGIQPQVVADVLENWPEGKQKPKALYTIPVGSNPTGYTATLDRRLEILALARKHEFLILEDDPYYYLYYGEKPRPPSYFALESIDRSAPAGLVVRFDSMSKILSSGFRLGFVTGPSRILDAIDGQTALSNLQPATFSQSVALAILKSWGYENFIAHTYNVSAFYQAKRDVFVAAMERHMTGLAEWVAPEAGMFLWFKLNLPGEDPDSAQLIREKAFNAGVLALPGVVAFPSEPKTAYCRASFSLLNDKDMDEACRRLAAVVRDAQATS